MHLASPTFAAAVFPDTWQIGATRLHTHCLGHALLLQRLGNPYAEARANAVPELGALVMAAYVCSRDPEVAAARAGGWWCRNWGVRQAILWGATHADREAEFRLYIAAAWQSPEFRIPGKRSGPASAAGADPLHVLWMHRRMQMGESEAQAMRCPLLRARWDLLAWAEQQGAIEIIGSDAEEREDEFLAACRANAAWDIEMRAAGRN